MSGDCDCGIINQSVYDAQGSTIEYSKQNEYKMKTTRENKTTLKMYVKSRNHGVLVEIFNIKYPTLKT